MDARVAKLRQMIMDRKQETFRREIPSNPEEYRREGLSPMERMTRRLCAALKAQTPVVFPEERIAYWRTTKNIPDAFTAEELAEQGKTNVWGVGNVCPDYATTIRLGLNEQKRRILARMETADEKQREFLSCVLRSVEAVTSLAKRYREEALRVGNQTVADTLAKVPEQGAQTFLEALQFFRILHFALWCEGEMHNCIGRFDQYMYPYWKQDIDSGRLTEEEAFSLLEEFFVTFNRDNDLYPGVQKGDNGQSMMLGGVTREGKPAFNELSSQCLKASRELLLIDPKINLRVDKNTPPSVFYEGMLLTKAGLGFPQYSNDDVVIPGLTKLGYRLEDARDYTVAACWEFIIPRYGMDIPNIDAFDFPDAVSRCVERLDKFASYEDFWQAVKEEIRLQCDRRIENANRATVLPAPFISLLMDDCIDRAQDVSEGARYNNYGFHGVGLSAAVDALASVKLHVFDKKDVSPRQMMEAVESDFAGQSELLNLLRYRTPKFGDGDSLTDEIACQLTEWFGQCLNGRKNNRGGIFRAGTGSAMYYVWYGDNSKATPGGHRKGEAWGANYAPELSVQNKGPLSVIQSFTKPDLGHVINGGPLTMEFHDSVFRDEESIWKVAGLVRSFVLMGGHQLQLNSVNREILLDAQKHPENYQNLIVRVWGWSAYFVQLDKKYQDHVIARQEFQL